MNNTGMVIEFVNYLKDNKYLTDSRIDKETLKTIYNEEFRENSDLRFSAFLNILRNFGLTKYKTQNGLTTIKFCLNAFSKFVLKFSNPDNASWKKKKLVNQAVAFPSKVVFPEVTNSTTCKICNSIFNDIRDYEEHITDISHKLRVIYRRNKNELYIRNDDIKLKFLQKNIEVDEVKMYLQSQTQILLLIQNTSIHLFTVLDVILLNSKLDKVSLKYQRPFDVPTKSTVTIPVDLFFKDEGCYFLPVVVVTINETNNKVYNFFKELILSIEPQDALDLGPTLPYKGKQRAVVSLEEYPIVEGVPPKSVPKELTYKFPLKKYNLPEYVVKILNSAFKEFRGITPTEKQKLTSIKNILNVRNPKNCLAVNNYKNLLELLLFIEEHQMRLDIHEYDCKNQTLSTIKGKRDLLALEVPGLSENRPSLVKRDSLTVTVEGTKVGYEGYIHQIRETTVELGFDRSFLEKVHQNNQKYTVYFNINRHTLKTEHQAVHLIKQHKAVKYFFPDVIPKVLPINTVQYKWFDRNILTNEKQQQAVRQIILCSSFPAPYLVFGPPGSGKTMTIVETILQIWSTKPECNILVAAPSNSAANEVTCRLVKYIPTTDLFRMISSSFTYESIPESIRKYCNFSEDYFYPSLEKIMKYRIVVVTLTAAAKLVNAAIPVKHFSYLFIDESGHATETETLIPIAGILTSQKEKELGGQIVLAGDPNQLGPIIHSKLAKQYGFGTSMLERLMTTNNLYKKDPNTGYNKNVLTKLLNNYRSHPAILKISNELFYDKEMIPCGKELVNIGIGWDYLPNKKFPIIFHSIQGKDEKEGCSPSYFNMQEINIVVRYVGYLVNNRLQGRQIKESDIGIISPYRRQVQKIELACKKKNWRDILVGSVEQFQGQERLIIIISTVRSTQKLVDEDYKFHLGFLKNPKRFNVAITRAKALLIVIGNPKVLQTDRYWGEFLKYCVDNKATTGQPFEYKPLWSETNDSENFVDIAIESNINDPHERADFSRGNM